MTTQKHTPGPWKVVHEEERYPGWNGPIPHSIGTSDGETIIARCPDGWGAEDNANARLIAAAPELLDALSEIMSHRTPIPDEDSDYVPRLIIDQARAAIHKATGEDSVMDQDTGARR